MAIDSIILNNLVLAVILIAPGVIALKLYDRHAKTKKRNFRGSDLIKSVVFSCGIYAVVIPLFFLGLDFVPESLTLDYLTISVLATILVVPIATSKLIETFEGVEFKGFSPIPEVGNVEAWDDAFEKFEDSGALVIITLKEGSQIAGVYGQDSAINDDPGDGDIYLEKTVEIEDGEPKSEENDNNAGIWLRKEDIESVEFFTEET